MAPTLHLDPDAVLDVAQHAAALAIAADHLHDFAVDDPLPPSSFGELGQRAGSLCAGLARQLAESVTTASTALDELSAALSASAEQARGTDQDASAGMQRVGG